MLFTVYQIKAQPHSDNKKTGQSE